MKKRAAVKRLTTDSDSLYDTWQAVKYAYSQAALVFVESGESFVTFDEDARTASTALDLPMIVIDQHSAFSFLETDIQTVVSQLLEKEFHVAVCQKVKNGDKQHE